MKMAKCHPNRKHYAKGLCVACYSGMGRKKHPERNRKYNLKATTGISLEQYEEMWTKQKGKCANPHCSIVAPLIMKNYRTDGLQVDHDHQTGKIRGLLCHGCNSALGHINDNLYRMEGLAKYLHPKNMLEDFCIVIGVMDYSTGHILVTQPQDGAEGSIKRDMGLVLNQRIKEGYELQGGITFISGDMYGQAIIKWTE